jgi:hypothetical protein
MTRSVLAAFIGTEQVTITVPWYFLYYPNRRQQPAALSALIETLRL